MESAKKLLRRLRGRRKYRNNYSPAGSLPPSPSAASGAATPRPSSVSRNGSRRGSTFTLNRRWRRSVMKIIIIKAPFFRLFSSLESTFPPLQLLALGASPVEWRDENLARGVPLSKSVLYSRSPSSKSIVSSSAPSLESDAFSTLSLREVTYLSTNAL